MRSNISLASCLTVLGSLAMLVAGCCSAPSGGSFAGLNMSMGNPPRLSDAQSRSLCAENFTGEKGKAAMATQGTGANAARDLGKGWKVSPSIRIDANKTVTLADIDGPGAIQQIWMTPTGDWRKSILRIYWDGQAAPSVECPVGDFFCMGLGKYAQISSLPVCVNPGSAFNCYWQMPFRKHCRITMTNIADKGMTLYYQINYTLTPVPADAAYFHAQFRRAKAVPDKQVYTILDGVKGKGQYVGTYLIWNTKKDGWWGEGEVKFYLDGDKEFPTICGTGTEDYFCGSYDFNVSVPPPAGLATTKPVRKYQPFCTPYTGLVQVLPNEEAHKAGQHFGLYRWHIADPVRFQQDLRVTIQALGWQTGGRYLPLEDDISSVAFWYQTLPTAPFPALPDKAGLENN